jgi:anti-sigma B factor antagonist
MDAIGTEMPMSAFRIEIPIEPSSRPFAQRAKYYQLGLIFNRSCAIVTLIGDIDVAAAPDLNRLLESLETFSSPVEIDMSAVTFLDSSGLAPLIAATRRRIETCPPLYISARSRPVQRLLHAAGMIDGPVLDIRGWDQLATVLAARF